MASYRLNGELKRWRGSEEALARDIPAGAQKLRATRIHSRLETFFSAGTVSDAVFKPAGVGLELVAVTHPNDLRAGEKATSWPAAPIAGTAEPAAPLFECIEVDCGDRRLVPPAQPCCRHQRCAGLDIGPAFADWRLAERRLLNPGSAGAPASRPLAGLAIGRSGAGGRAGRPGPAARIFGRFRAGRWLPALAGAPASQAGSAFGLASGWLCRQAVIGAPVALRLRQHRRFRLEHNAQRPLILIGNGSGMAGLRGHLKARAGRPASQLADFLADAGRYRRDVY